MTMGLVNNLRKGYLYPDRKDPGQGRLFIGN